MENIPTFKVPPRYCLLHDNLTLPSLSRQSNTTVAVNLTGGEGAPIDISATASVNVDVLWKNSKNLDEFKNSTNKETIMQGNKIDTRWMIIIK